MLVFVSNVLNKPKLFQSLFKLANYVIPLIKNCLAIQTHSCVNLLNSMFDPGYIPIKLCNIHTEDSQLNLVYWNWLIWNSKLIAPWLNGLQQRTLFNLLGEKQVNKFVGIVKNNFVHWILKFSITLNFQEWSRKKSKKGNFSFEKWIVMQTKKVFN